MNAKTWINQETELLTADDLTMRIGDERVKVIGFWTHTKATEDYVVLSIYGNDAWKDWYIPHPYPGFFQGSTDEGISPSI